MNQIIIQGIGYIALFFSIISFQQKKRRNVLFYITIAQIFFSLHFSLLHAWTGATMNVIGALRTTVFYQKDTKIWAQHVAWMYIFLAAFFLAGLLTWTNYASLLPFAAMTIDTLATWRGSAKSIRFLLLISTPLWLFYDFLVGSYPGMITEVIILSSIIIGILRLDIPKKLKFGQNRNL